jgi:hypothetical protein
MITETFVCAELFGAMRAKKLRSAKKLRDHGPLPGAVAITVSWQAQSRSQSAAGPVTIVVSCRAGRDHGQLAEAVRARTADKNAA